VTTPSTPGRRRRLGKGLATVLATGLLLAACGGDGDRGGAGEGAGGRTPTPPTSRPVEANAPYIKGWDPCEVLGDHLREFVEFLDYKGFQKDPFSTSGDNTAGVRLCSGYAIYLEDPKSEFGKVGGSIDFGFGTAGMVGSTMMPEEYQTPTGRYDMTLQLQRDVYDADTLAERTEDGPWDEATVLLGNLAGTTLSAFILDTERDFMLRLSVVLTTDRADEGELTWTLEEAAQHFREVTMVNAYQAMADRFDEES
jgi:hypothetical protein